MKIVRFKQITTASDGEGNNTLYGLDDTGVVWEYLYPRMPYLKSDQTISPGRTAGWTQLTDDVSRVIADMEVK